MNENPIDTLTEAFGGKPDVIPCIGKVIMFDDHATKLTHPSGIYAPISSRSALQLLNFRSRRDLNAVSMYLMVSCRRWSYNRVSDTRQTPLYGPALPDVFRNVANSAWLNLTAPTERNTINMILGEARDGERLFEHCLGS